MSSMYFMSASQGSVGCRSTDEQGARISTRLEKNPDMTLLADLVATSQRVQATRSRSAKVAALAEFLAAVEPDEAELAVAYLAGQTRQGRVGVGWATVGSVAADGAAEPTLAIADLDAAITDLQGISGGGSN